MPSLGSHLLSGKYPVEFLFNAAYHQHVSHSSSTLPPSHAVCPARRAWVGSDVSWCCVVRGASSSAARLSVECGCLFSMKPTNNTRVCVAPRPPSPHPSTHLGLTNHGRTRRSKRQMNLGTLLDCKSRTDGPLGPLVCSWRVTKFLQIGWFGGCLFHDMYHARDLVGARSVVLGRNSGFFSGIQRHLTKAVERPTWWGGIGLCHC